jgi:hypothetical protein
MLTSRIGRLASLYVVTCAIGACSDSQLTFGGPLDLVLTSNSPVPQADSLVVNYQVEGTTLVGMAVTWGDSSVDSLYFSGAQQAGGRLAHLYSTDGAYTITARVQDANQGSITEELTVTVNP